MICIVGVSHHTAPLELREALAFAKERLMEALRRVRDEASAAEAMILSTCNRVELYGRCGEPGSERALERFLYTFHGRGEQELARFVYRLQGDDAVRHAFRVAASLDSMVIGEPQILGQVKQAYQVAEQAGTLGPALSALRNRSLACAKRARSETGIGQNAVSISNVAVELARKIFGDLRGCNVLLVGAGKMTELAARQLVRSGALATVLAGRSFARAAELAALLGGQAAPFDTLGEQLAVADIVISGTGAVAAVIGVEDVERARRARGQRPLFLIDIAVPRDVEEGVGKLDGVFLYDLDDLKAVADSNLRERRKEAAAAEALVEREVRDFIAWQKSLEIVPLLQELRRRGDEIRRAEVEKARKRLGSLSPEQEAALDAATAGIVNKLLHAPTVHLKELARDGQGPEQVGLIRKLFGL